MTWDLRQLRDNVFAIHGWEQLSLAKPCLQSIFERAHFARYHYQEAKRLMDPFTSKVEQSQIAALNLLLGGKDEEQEVDFQTVRTQAAANMLACLQSMHACADIMGHTIYFVLAMNLDSAKSIPDRNIDAGSVHRKLAAGSIKAAFGELIDHDGFRYLSAVVNRSKHRSVVSIPYSIQTDMSVAPWHGLKLSAFEHHGIHHNDRWAEIYLNEEYSRQQTAFQAIGQALNDETNKQRTQIPLRP
jgi:hypothetical protein